METLVRKIVADLGPNVATKRIVRQTYKKKAGLTVLSGDDKKLLNQCLNKIVEELTISQIQQGVSPGKNDDTGTYKDSTPDIRSSVPLLLNEDQAKNGSLDSKVEIKRESDTKRSLSLSRISQFSSPVKKHCPKSKEKQSLSRKIREKKFFSSDTDDDNRSLVSTPSPLRETQNFNGVKKRVTFKNNFLNKNTAEKERFCGKRSVSTPPKSEALNTKWKPGEIKPLECPVKSDLVNSPTMDIRFIGNGTVESKPFRKSLTPEEVKQFVLESDSDSDHSLSDFVDKEMINDENYALEVRCTLENELNKMARHIKINPCKIELTPLNMKKILENRQMGKLVIAVHENNSNGFKGGVNEKSNANTVNFSEGRRFDNSNFTGLGHIKREENSRGRRHIKKKRKFIELDSDSEDVEEELNCHSKSVELSTKRNVFDSFSDSFVCKMVGSIDAVNISKIKDDSMPVSKSRTNILDNMTDGRLHKKNRIRWGSDEENNSISCESENDVLHLNFANEYKSPGKQHAPKLDDPSELDTLENSPFCMKHKRIKCLVISDSESELSPSGIEYPHIPSVPADELKSNSLIESKIQINKSNNSSAMSQKSNEYFKNESSRMLYDSKSRRNLEKSFNRSVSFDSDDSHQRIDFSFKISPKKSASIQKCSPQVKTLYEDVPRCIGSDSRVRIETVSSCEAEIKVIACGSTNMLPDLDDLELKLSAKDRSNNSRKQRGKGKKPKPTRIPHSKTRQGEVSSASLSSLSDTSDSDTDSYHHHLDSRDKEHDTASSTSATHDDSEWNVGSTYDSDLSDSERTEIDTDKEIRNARKGFKKARKVSGKSQSQDGKQEKVLSNLRKICHHVGMVLRNSIELIGCETTSSKVNRIKELLKKKGLKGRPSMKSAEQFILERELKDLGHNIGTVDSGDRLQSRPRRSHQRKGTLQDRSIPQHTARTNLFSYMSDVFTVDDSSD